MYNMFNVNHLSPACGSTIIDNTISYSMALLLALAISAVPGAEMHFKRTLYKKIVYLQLYVHDRCCT